MSITSIEEVEGVGVIRVNQSKLFSDTDIQRFGWEIFPYVDHPEESSIGGLEAYCVDLGNVEFMSAAVFGKLITMHKKLKAQDKRLYVCNVCPEVYEVFAITRLNRQFIIKDSVEDVVRDYQFTRNARQVC